MNTRTDKPYGELGKLMDSMAQRATAVTGCKVTGQAVSRYFYGESWPKPVLVWALADAIGLTKDERETLA